MSTLQSSSTRINDDKQAAVLNNEAFMIAAAQYKRRTSGAVPRHGLPEASMAAELQLSLAKNISMIAEDLETMTPRELYERVLTGTENVLKETFRKMEKKQTKTENWCGYIQGVATRAARAGTEAPNNDGVIQHNNENHNPRRRGKNHIDANRRGSR